jgi:hypothetical protein
MTASTNLANYVMQNFERGFQEKKKLTNINNGVEKIVACAHWVTEEAESFTCW